MIQRKLIFTGRVQGVGFRYTAYRIARQYLVTGWVKNLDDGSVEMVVEGAEADIGQFVREVEETINGLGYGRVDLCSQISDLAASGEYDAFEIR